jgi:site-specific recombinase XerD
MRNTVIPSRMIKDPNGVVNGLEYRMPDQPPRLLDQVRAALRRKHYAIRTEEAYVSWITRYIRFHQLRHPQDLGIAEIEAFLTYLTVDDQVAASTQNQALSALLFLYAEVFGQPIDAPLRAVRAKQPQRLPTVLTREEVRGLRLLECLRLRVTVSPYHLVALSLYCC